MDPVSQGAVAAVASQNAARGHPLLAATLLGFLSGLSPDLDVLIHSDVDPLLSLEYHRQFTHSLVFIPVGGLLCATLFHLVYGRWKGVPFRHILTWCTVGYATHGLLDACTSYGTQLLWPFSDVRISWSIIAIIDPLFTLPTLGLVAVAAVRRNLRYARYAAVWALCYLALGLVQRERAEAAGHELAAARGHEPVRLEAKPAIGNLLLWKVIYETGSRYHVDGVRTGLITTLYPGEHIDMLDIPSAYPWLNPDSQQARDIERFRWFSEGFIAASPDDPNRIIDARYSMLPNEVAGLWMIVLDPGAGPDEHVGYAHDHENSSDTWPRFVDMLLGRPLDD